MGLRELDVFVGLMHALRRVGLVDWRAAPSDVRGDDFPHAVEFHLTEHGRGSLPAPGGHAARGSLPAYSSPVAGLLGHAR